MDALKFHRMSGLRYESRLESRLNWLDGALRPPLRPWSTSAEPEATPSSHARSVYRATVGIPRLRTRSRACGLGHASFTYIGLVRRAAALEPARSIFKKTVSASESKPTNGARRAVIRARQVAERADTLHCPSNERRSFRQGSACIQERVAPFLGSSQKVSYLLAIAP